MLLIIVFAMFSAVQSSPADAPLLPWETNPEYYRALEHDYRLDAIPNHVHFVDPGKIDRLLLTITKLLTRFNIMCLTDLYFIRYRHI